MKKTTAVTHTELPFPLFRRGKVRDVYDLGDTLLLIATDRISAFDHVLEPGIPGKGILLTQLSTFWFERLSGRLSNHLIATNVEDFPAALKPYTDILRGRSVLVRKTEPLPVECVCRGYLFGSAWKDYRADNTVCGHSLPEGLQLADRLPEPIFTPATKAQEGHDENISFTDVANLLGEMIAVRLRDITIDLYVRAADYAAGKGIILADGKLEFGLLDGEIIWIDEAFTSDSSRFWPAESYRPGLSPPSFDKQFVRDFLEETAWDKNSSPPPLPPGVVEKTLRKYREAYEILTGRSADTLVLS